MMKQITGAQSQRGAILEWFLDRDAADWDEYIDAAQSGADDSREARCELLDAVLDDHYDNVIMTEIKRFSPFFRTTTRLALSVGLLTGAAFNRRAAFPSRWGEQVLDTRIKVRRKRECKFK